MVVHLCDSLLVSMYFLAQLQKLFCCGGGEGGAGGSIAGYKLGAL